MDEDYEFLMPPKPVEVLAEEGVDWAVKEMDRREIIALASYLAGTDWYATRRSETGKGIPEDIGGKRQEARDRISELRSIK